jgi:hypothetical protein
MVSLPLLDIQIDVITDFTIDNPGQISIKLEELPTPEPGLGEVLVRITVRYSHLPYIPQAHRSKYNFSIQEYVTAISAS